MSNFELDGLTTPEHELKRWREAAAAEIETHVSDPTGLKKIPEGEVLRFEHGRTLEVYLGAPAVEGSVRPTNDEILREATTDFQEVARRSLEVDPEDSSRSTGL